MTGPAGPGAHLAKVVTVSDGVVAGTREDRSGGALAELLGRSGFEVVERRVIADGVATVAAELARACAGFRGLVVTTGGTGFAPRDHTPEGTAEVIERPAPGLAEAMRLASPLGRLSRAVAGTRGEALILNTPGSPAGAVECLQAVLDVLPHALDLLAGGADRPPPPVTDRAERPGGEAVEDGEAGEAVRDEAAVRDEDAVWMAEALAAAASVRTTTSPNPWVGAVVVPAGDAPVVLGATQPPGGPHAEAVALDLAGASARGSTVYVTLEPCSHHGRTPPCADALVDAGVARVVVALEDPDPHVAGRGFARLRAAGIATTVGVGAAEAAEQLAPYLRQRRTGRPLVVLKLAATLDGRIAAPDRSSRWITGPEARLDAHRLRAESDAIAVGAGTVRADDPALTVRGVEGRDPLRVVLGAVPPGARVAPALEHRGSLEPLLDDLGRRGVLQLLVEGGAGVAHDFHHAGLVDRYVLYLAPALLGGDDGVGAFAGPGAATMAEAWRGRITSVARLGADLRVDLLPLEQPGAEAVP